MSLEGLWEMLLPVSLALPRFPIWSESDWQSAI